MLNRKDVVRFRKYLVRWYDKNKRYMPWRETGNPYLIWVSEVMLQQTQVKTVIPYYDRFIERFPDIQSIAKADLEDVLKLWEGLGYYSRARNFHKACCRVIVDHDGQVPDNIYDFIDLPGVGDYIASAVQSICFNHPGAVVDGNVKRVLARLFQLDFPVNKSNSHAEFSKVANQLLDIKIPGTFNQAMMELGALVCKPGTPVCEFCPVVAFCLSFSQHTTDLFPKRIKRKKVPEYRISVGVVEKKGKFLITKRKPDGLLGGLWEFPGGKIKKGETPEIACLREIKEETNLDVKTLRHLTTVRHTYTHFKIHMDVYLCEFIRGRVSLKGPVDFRWITLKEIEKYPFPKANHKFFKALKKAFD